MIGQIRFRRDDIEIVATLHDDLTWTVPGHPEAERALNAGYGRDPDYSPADGQPGYPQLRDAADDLGGEAEFAEIDPMPPGTIY